VAILYGYVQEFSDFLPEIQTNGNRPLESKDTNAHQTTNLEPPLEGPAIGPTMPADIPMGELLEEEQESTPPSPKSPYSANRAQLRGLTLPLVPNYDIPPSPPGSPVASANAKFKHFLELKKQGVHFNEKLAKSSAMKNPALMQKLMDFADITEAGQYATTLPKDIWDPSGFPVYAFKDELAKSQQKILKRKEEEQVKGQRAAIDFVPAAAVSSDNNRSGTPSTGLGGRNGQKSAAERVMAGLDRGRSNSPHIQGVKRKTRFES